MSESDAARSFDRREFLKWLGAASLAVALPGVAGTAQAQALAPPVVPTATPVPPATDTAPSEDARALTAILQRRFLDRLTPAQWESVARDFDGDLAQGKRLRGLKLANGDEPDVTFRA